MRAFAGKRWAADAGYRLTQRASNGATADDLRGTLDEVYAEGCKRLAGGDGDGNHPISFGQFSEKYPALRPPVIDGLLREGETANIVAPTKIGKSWLVYLIALCVAVGRRLFDIFDCNAGPVLLIDNELHPPTIAHRIPKVAQALQIAPSQYDNRLDVLPLRGRDVSIHDLRQYVQRIETGHYKLIILDAWYRFIPAGLNENSNADIMALYNTLDSYAAMTSAAWVVIHHSSKGGQGEKAVTDVGSGAGSQSRAADSHIVLRQHDDPGVTVMEAAVRSFPPVVPVGLRWEFPVWKADVAIDTTALKGRRPRNEERQDERDSEGMEAIRKAMADGPKTPRQVRAKTGFGAARAERLLDRLEADGEAICKTKTVRGNEAREYQLTE